MTTTANRMAQQVWRLRLQLRRIENRQRRGR
jgi:hypothetical protein